MDRMTSGTKTDTTQRTHPSRTPAHPARGRHRRPRPRRLLLTAGGLAVAAGILSLVRLSAEPDVVGSLGPSRTGPAPDPVTTGGTGDRATHTDASPARAPEPTPSAPSAQGGAARTATTTTGPSVRVPTATRSPTHTGIAVPDASTVPRTPNPPPAPAPDATTAPDPAGPPAPTSAAPRPKPTPTAAPTTATPAPGHPDGPVICVPVIGLCVDVLDEDR
ncbi:hypothetical protein AB0L04_33340 [Streptomyces glaucescens]|uniref:hypothetical protein n=1 Tax=Streptomyces glaucescens TaxID=1907 RepID=UPI00344F8BA3